MVIPISVIDPSQNPYANNPSFNLAKNERLLRDENICKMTYVSSASTMKKVAGIAIALFLTIATLGIIFCFDIGFRMWRNVSLYFKQYPIYVLSKPYFSRLPKDVFPNILAAYLSPKSVHNFSLSNKQNAQIAKPTMKSLHAWNEAYSLISLNLSSTHESFNDLIKTLTKIDRIHINFVKKFYNKSVLPKYRIQKPNLVYYSSLMYPFTG